MPTIIVTDLTHFANVDTVCIAGVDINTFECFRPLPYLSPAQCVDIYPGVFMTLDGQYAGAQHPHCEDYNYTEYIVGEYSAESFQNVLDHTLSPSIEQGFGVGVIERRCISHENPPAHSIITIRVIGANVSAVVDRYNEDRIRVHIVDNDGNNYSFLPCAELSRYNAAIENRNLAIQDFNDYTHQHGYVYLRIGIGRRHQAADRDGFWLQLNGIYGF